MGCLTVNTAGDSGTQESLCLRGHLHFSHSLTRLREPYSGRWDLPKASCVPVLCFMAEQHPLKSCPWALWKGEWLQLGFGDKGMGYAQQMG